MWRNWNSLLDILDFTCKSEVLWLKSQGYSLNYRIKMFAEMRDGGSWKNWQLENQKEHRKGNYISSYHHEHIKEDLTQTLGNESFVWKDCEGLSTFHCLRELLSGFVSTNTTQILQARKQMECDNNKY